MLSVLLGFLAELRLHLGLRAHGRHALQEVPSHRLTIGGSVEKSAS